MHRSLLLLAIAAALTSCAEPAPAPAPSSDLHMEVDTGEEAVRTIILTKGDSLSVGVDTEGNVTITATIAEGKPGAGVYTSQDAGMYDTAIAAKEGLNAPGTEVSVDVGADGDIVAVSYAVTLSEPE
jgi:hypothetical protein